MTLRWKKNSRPTGLMAVGAGPRGSKLHDGESEYASVYAKRNGHEVKGWYWVARHDPYVRLMNTCNEPLTDEATAKAAAMAYVKAELKRTVQPQED